MFPFCCLCRTDGDTQLLITPKNIDGRHQASVKQGKNYSGTEVTSLLQAVKSNKETENYKHYTAEIEQTV